MWKQDVAILHFTDSICDRSVPATQEVTERPFACTECAVALATAKQWSLHRRIVHGECCPQRHYAGVRSDGTAPCPVCVTVFSVRLALIRHLCDCRRPACWNQILAAPGRFVRLSDAKTLELDDADKEARRAGRRAGHSHAVIPGGCISHDSRPCGRASA